MTDIDITQDANLTTNTAPALADRLLLVRNADSALTDITPDQLLKIINLLTTDSAPDRSADYVSTYDASATAVKKVLLQELGGYTLQMVLGAAVSPADATTYYFAPSALGVLITSATNHKVRIPRTGVIRKILIDGSCTVGSGETFTISLRLNDTTDTTITSAAVLNATPFVFSNTALSIAVTEGDFIIIKIATPTWVTNPTSVSMYAVIWIA